MKLNRVVCYPQVQVMVAEYRGLREQYDFFGRMAEQYQHYCDVVGRPCERMTHDHEMRGIYEAKREVAWEQAWLKEEQLIALIGRDSFVSLLQKGKK